MDLGDQADQAWLLSVQRKLYQWSRTHPEDSYRDLWNWITDLRNLVINAQRLEKVKLGQAPGALQGTDPDS